MINIQLKDKILIIQNIMINISNIMKPLNKNIRKVINIKIKNNFQIINKTKKNN